MTKGYCVILCVFLWTNFRSTVDARILTSDELHRLPKLFHLDEYERCLSQRDGVYCLGSFELTPARQPHPIYGLMKEHTNEPLKYNRTLLRRGYCVSERCPLERNATLRFERCVANFTARHALAARLRSAHYCITHQQHQAKASLPTNEGQQLYLYAIYAIILLNVMGTWYDLNAGQDSKKNSLLMAWSLPSNWDRLTKVSDSGLLAALAPLQFIRVLNQSIIIYAHTALLHYMVYVANPESLEELPHGILGTLIRNGTSLVQVYILISCFLTGYNLLQASQKSDINVGLICKWILKRLIRILPVYLLVLGFAITWWGRVNDGPLWAPIVGTETKICQRKFWYQIFFVSNLLEPAEPCLLQSWALAVDMQLYLLSLFLTVMFIKLRVRAVPVLGWCFAASGAFNVLLAYVGGWDPMVKMLTPENLRAVFRHTPSFPYIHTSPWSNMPACFLGLFMAHYYFEMTKKKVKVEDVKKIENQSEKNLNTNGHANGVGASNGHVKNCAGESNGFAQNGLGDSNRYTSNGIEAGNGHIKKIVEESNAHVDKEVEKTNKHDNNGVRESDGHAKYSVEDNNEYINNGIELGNRHINEIVGESNIHVNNGAGESNEHDNIGVDANFEHLKNQGIHIENNKNEVGDRNAVIETNRRTYNYNGLKENNLRQRHVANERNGYINTEEERYTINRGERKEQTDQIVCESNGFTNNDNECNGLNKNFNGESNGFPSIANSLNNGCKNSEGQNRSGHTYNVIEETNGHVKNGVGERNGNVQAKTEYKKDRPKKTQHFLLLNAHLLASITLTLWVLLGTSIEQTESRALVALYVGMERVMFSLMWAVILIHAFTIESGLRRFASWRGWQALGRLTYSITMLHWCVNVTIAAGRPTAIPSSVFYISLDWLATIFYSSILSLPVCLLLELPMQKFLDILINKC